MSQKSLRVLKFGGSSTGTAENLRQAIELIAAERARGPVAVVVSAMGDTTDRLIESVEVASRGELESAHRIVDGIAGLALENGEGVLEARGLASDSLRPVVEDLLAPLRQLLLGVSLVRERSRQTVDLVMSFGERLSATVVTYLLDAVGMPAAFVDSRTWTTTDDRFGDALVDWEVTRARLGELASKWGERIPVVTGFLGQTPDGRTTTLGRNGSDYTTTLLARGLGASEVVVWTDVSGVMTADPALVDEVYPIARLSYMEALELALFGARMFHPRTMIPLIESGIPLRIRNTLQPDEPGTLVDAAGSCDENRPTSVTSLENLALVGIECHQLANQTQVGERVLGALARAGVPAWMASQTAHGQAVALVVPNARAPEAEAAIRRELEPELERREVEAPRVRQPVTLVTLVAESMGRTPNVLGRFFHALGTLGVNVHACAQGASSRSVSCVVDAEDTGVAVGSVHAAFNLAHQQVSVFLLGRGVVGGQLLQQIAQQQQVLEREHGTRVRVVGIADSRRALFDERGLDLEGWTAQLEALPRGEGPLALVPLLERLRRLPVPVLVDCTAADGMEHVYSDAFGRGIHVVAANKKPLAIAHPERERLMASARRHHRSYHYETTVGASLPVIDTLKNLVRTGDHVRLIEGSFSGTLGYLTNELMNGVPLSKAVRVARELGYTEPHPRDDLSGLDVARKALILARELGLALELSDILVEPLVRGELLEEDDVGRFFAGLESEDAAFAASLDRMRQEGRVLRYLARIDPSGAEKPAVRVGPVAIPADHPATRLRGSESFVAFTTERYRDYPLIVQGAGAGGAVTAAGVLADVLTIAQSLRGR